MESLKRNWSATIRVQWSVLLMLSLLGMFLPSPVFALSITYQYDELNRLTQVSYDSETVIEYSYDASGNRTQRIISHANDTDVDGISDSVDNCLNTSNPSQDNNDGDAQGDACDLDDDNDGLTDEDEINLHGTNPLKPDTDNDGIKDKIELEAGFDPNDPDDFPVLPEDDFGSTGKLKLKLSW